MDGPPPPPPPHGANPRSTAGGPGGTGGLPPGNYDIFIIPPHSSGGGFVYLPSLQVQRNSFLAGVASTVAIIAVWVMIEPSIKQYFIILSASVSSGGNGVVLLAVIVGIAGWALGKTQMGGGSSDGKGPGDGPRGGAGGAASGSGYQRAPPPQPNGGFPGGAPPPPPPHGSSGGGWQGHQHHQHGAPPHRESWGGTQPDPSADAGWEKAQEDTRSQAEEEARRKEEERERAEEAKQRKEEEIKRAQEERRRAEEERKRAEEERRRAEEERRQAKEERKRAEEAERKRAEEAQRRKEEERKKAEEAQRQKEEEQKRQEEAARQARAKAEKEKWEKMRAREREQRERDARERIARERLQKEKEQREKEAREREALEAETRAKIEKEIREKLEAEQKVKAAEEAKKKAEAEKAAAEAKAAKEKADAERAERLKAARERAQREREARLKAEAEKLNTPTVNPLAERRSTTYGGLGGGERTDIYGRGPPAPSVASAQTSPIKVTISPKKNYEKPSAKSYVETDDAHSFRPYDVPNPQRPPKPPSHHSSIFSESSYAPSQSTARTTPPSSQRGPYSTADPDKIQIKAVYMFNNMFPKPVAQLVAGIGSVTDGLILKVTTEGLFIDDDVRHVAQREWDIKAWTLKLVETGEKAGTHVLRATIRDSSAKNYVFLIEDSESWKVAVGLQRLRRGSQVRSLGVSQLPAAEITRVLNLLPPIA